MKITVNALGAVALLAMASCGGENFGTFAGVQPITGAPGPQLYFKREVRGMNFDELGITTNPNLCQSLDPAVDYYYPTLGPIEVFYAIDGHTLKIYSTSELQAPPRPSFTLRVESHVLSPLEWQELERTYRERGLRKVSVPILQPLEEIDCD